MSDRKNLPELLSPAGSPLALEAAIEAGADAVYFGGARHNARVNAKNFSETDIPAAVDLAHAHKVKVYFTLNTLATDRELPELLDEARAAAQAGVDAIIMADLGAAAAIRRAIPGLPIHASTQASGHNTASGNEFAKLGFSRMVIAREASLEDIRTFTRNSLIEAEIFIHGALCVCHSGQCLYSSMVGGRSGNRGECAQPCRLPFKSSEKNSYPLSLRDLSLARYVPELIDSGVASLKIEGRMKPPEYVLAVTRVWRKLLNERRAASDSEMEYLAGVFSRGGFTDGYFTKNIGRGMLGVRSEEDKTTSRALEKFTGLTKKVTLDMNAEILPGIPMKLTVSSGAYTVTVTGDIPEVAVNTPSDRGTVKRNLTKLGQTPYSAGTISLKLGDGLAIPVSRLNALRRSAVEAISAAVRRPASVFKSVQPILPVGVRHSIRTARFIKEEQIPDEADGYFDIIYLPLGKLVESFCGKANGVILPSVIFDSEMSVVEKQLEAAARLGIRHALVGNIGHIAVARKFGFIIHGDFRLNVTNSTSVAVCESLGFSDIILSSELTLPQVRDIAGNTQTLVYGRIPLMLLEKCVIKDTSGCAVCRDEKADLTDRRGVVFPVYREEPHRNIIYNSQPTYMADRTADLDRFRITAQHFIFSTESKREVTLIISAYKSGTASVKSIRRIQM